MQRPLQSGNLTDRTLGLATSLLSMCGVQGHGTRLSRKKGGGEGKVGLSPILSCQCAAALGSIGMGVVSCE